MLTVLGLETLLSADAEQDEPDADALRLLGEREAARAAKDWAQADLLRDKLLDRGWQVRVGDDGASLVAL
jgi:cysteinyl-tRNA synthetase